MLLAWERQPTNPLFKSRKTLLAEPDVCSREYASFTVIMIGGAIEIPTKETRNTEVCKYNLAWGLYGLDKGNNSPTGIRVRTVAQSFQMDWLYARS